MEAFSGSMVVSGYRVGSSWTARVQGGTLLKVFWTKATQLVTYTYTPHTCIHVKSFHVYINITCGIKKSHFIYAKFILNDILIKKNKFVM